MGDLDKWESGRHGQHGGGGRRFCLQRPLRHDIPSLCFALVTTTLIPYQFALQEQTTVPMDLRPSTTLWDELQDKATFAENSEALLCRLKSVG